MTKKKISSIIRHIPSGVPGLDSVLGGGLPELSFNLIAGGPGAGKTTMAMQVLFANSTVKHPGLFITLLGEPALKLLRYQQHFDFFDTSRVGKDIQLLNLSGQVMEGNLEKVLESIVTEVERLRPKFVVIDSFRALLRSHTESPVLQVELEHFIQRLAHHLTTWEVTSFLIGEYSENELRNPICTVADGILWLTQAVDRNSVVRKLQVVKMRGLEMMPGLHTFRITGAGLQVFPRMLGPTAQGEPKSRERLSTGIVALDEMMGGGIPSGDSLVIAGPTGTGKTTFGAQFIAEGIRKGEASVVAVFEERPEDYIARASSMGVDFQAAIDADKLRVIYLRPLDLSVDETLDETRKAVAEIGATRVVIDSISGFEMALAPTFREDFRESLYRLVSALTALGITIVMTVENVDTEAAMKFTNYGVSFLTDDIIVQRYAEIEGQLRKVLVIVKMRGSKHSRDFRTYELTGHGVVMGELLRDFDGIITGVPKRQARIQQPLHPGLTEREMLVLEALIQAPETDASSLAVRTGLEVVELQEVLDRLVRLEYASSTKNRYRAIARSSGP